MPSVTHMDESCCPYECVMLHAYGTCRKPCVATCCRVPQWVAMCCSALQCVAMRCRVLQCVAMCFSVLQCVAICRRVLQCVGIPSTVLEGIGWLPLVGSLKSKVSFAKETYKRDDTLQKRPVIFCTFKEPVHRSHPIFGWLHI